MPRIKPKKPNIDKRQKEAKAKGLPEYDIANQCVLCHIKLEKGNYRPMYCKWGIDRPSYDKLIIIMCLDCINEFDADDHEEIMESVVNGWEIELKRSKSLDKEHKQRHRDVYNNRKIFAITSRR